MNQRKSHLKGCCKVCHKPWSVELPEEGVQQWRNKTLPLRKAFPDLTPSEARLLARNICPRCYAERKIAKERRNDKKQSGAQN